MQIFTHLVETHWQATIVTGETGLAMGNHNIVTRIYPYHEDGSVELFVGLRGTHIQMLSLTLLVVQQTPLALCLSGRRTDITAQRCIFQETGVTRRVWTLRPERLGADDC